MKRPSARKRRAVSILLATLLILIGLGGTPGCVAMDPNASVENRQLSAARVRLIFNATKAKFTAKREKLGESKWLYYGAILDSAELLVAEVERAAAAGESVDFKGLRAQAELKLTELVIMFALDKLEYL